MRKAIISAALLFLGIGVSAGFLISVSAEEGLIPSWIKTTAEFWVNDQVSDQEFISALQYLVQQGILTIPSTDSQEKNLLEEGQIDTSSSETIVESADEFINNSNVFLVQSNPEKYNGRWAQLYGEIMWEPEIYDDIIEIWLNLDQGDENSFGENLILAGTRNADPSEYRKGTCLYVEGKILPAERIDMFDEKFIEAALDLYEVKELSCLEAKYPTVKTVVVNESQESNELRVTVEKIEFTDYHTRVFVEIENLSKTNESDYFYKASKIVQEQKQFTPTRTPWTLDIDEMERNILPETLEKGIMFFEKVEQKPFTLVIKGSYASYDDGLPEFTFNVEI